MKINILQIIRKAMQSIRFLKKPDKIETIKKTIKRELKKNKHKGCFGSCKNKELTGKYKPYKKGEIRKRRIK